MKKFFAVVVLLLLSVPLLAQSNDSPATSDDIRQMLAVMNSRKMIDSMMETMAKDLPEMLLASVDKQYPDLTAEQRKALVDFATKSVTDMFKRMPLDEMMDTMVPVYQKHFTHGDIQQVIAFYSSPVGKKMIAELPEVTRESMQSAMPVIQNWVNAEMERTQREAEEMASKLSAEKSKSDADKKTPAKAAPSKDTPKK